ncbi:heparinase II/III domain-containing protein [Lacticaseibacillus daqingensis]|uniref:heparinase II/III domain-containing protein n=1 Tax=Lacticaseibacillus daqingensis TaxID=2486014 RepID=UPI000F79751B|nr:heparinase II/III family protein [Lacticaseibacillus daqingensis]
MTEQAWATHLKHLATAEALEGPALIARAERLMQDDYRFDAPYAMEPTQTTVHLAPLDWRAVPNGDPEWRYMLQRQEYLLELLGAGLLTDDPRFFAKMKALLLSAVVADADPTNWRTLDIGLRLMAWAPVVASLQRLAQLTVAEQVQIDQAVSAQIAFLMAHERPTDGLSNWGILITSGVLAYAARHPASVSRAQQAWAAERWQEGFALQVTPAGSHWEQAPLYQLEVLRSGLAVVAARQATGAATPPAVLHQLHQLAVALSQAVLPSGQLLQQGDSDAIAVASVLTTAEVLLGQPLRWAAVRGTYDWLLLALAHSSWPVPEAGHLARPRQFFDPISGNAFWRSGDEATADFWHAAAGPVGSGHGHANLGHIDLVIGGVPVLIDPGRGTYVDGPLRRTLKSAAAHNTLVLDDRPAIVPIDAWQVTGVGQPLAMTLQPLAQQALVRMRYRDADAVVTRTWLGLPDGSAYVLLDVVQAAGAHTATRYFQLGSTLTPTVVPGGAQLGPGLMCLSSAGTPQVTIGPWAPAYNVQATTHRLTLTHAFQDWDAQVTVFGALDAVVKAPLAAGVGAAATAGFTLHGPTHEWLLTVAPQPPANLMAPTVVAGVPTIGELNLFQREGDRALAHWRLA